MKLEFKFIPYRSCHTCQHLRTVVNGVKYQDLPFCWAKAGVIRVRTDNILGDCIKYTRVRHLRKL